MFKTETCIKIYLNMSVVVFENAICEIKLKMKHLGHLKHVSVIFIYLDLVIDLSVILLRNFSFYLWNVLDILKHFFDILVVRTFSLLFYSFSFLFEITFNLQYLIYLNHVMLNTKSLDLFKILIWDILILWNCQKNLLLFSYLKCLWYVIYRYHVISLIINGNILIN